MVANAQALDDWVTAHATQTTRQTADDTTKQTAGQQPEDAANLEVKSMVGPYRIEGPLGRGGMGRVYLCTDLRLQRRVALKFLLDSRAAPADVRSRIIHEARAAARISNQHVAIVHDVVEDESRAFIVMEYVDGETLSARIRRERLSAAQVIAIGRQLAAGLAAAHGEGIVHRDLKPANIHVTRSGLIKILDFGIASAARVLSTVPTGAPTTGVELGVVTQHHLAHAGTPPYMSPEQILGRAVDERSDLYSLGAVLFEMCTGHRPYPGSGAIEIARAQATGVPRADATAGVPRALADVVARAMATDVDERFQSAGDMDAALHDVERSLSAGDVDRRTRVTGMFKRLAWGGPAAAVTLWTIGFLTSVQFNFVFGRDDRFARFGREPWYAYIGWGLLAVFPILVVMVMTLATVFAVRFVFRLLALIGPIDALAGRVRAAARRLMTTSGLDHASNLAQALTFLSLAVLAVFFWHHAPLIRAWSSFFNSSPIASLLPMTDSAPARNEYHIELSVATLALGIGFYQVIRLRRRENTRDGRMAVAMLAFVITIMVILNELPYRTFQRRDFERIDLDGRRCYITGETKEEALVLCPSAEPPRNRTIRRDDPRFTPSGTKENVFKGVDSNGRAR
jgi:hypothetical protein